MTPHAAGATATAVGRILADETAIWLPLAMVAFVAASVLMTGWPAGVLPNLAYPFSYSGDALSAAWITQNILEGNWIFHTGRSGYPFGSDLLDYPQSDWGSFVVLRLAGWIAPSYWGAMNLYFLLGFPAACMAAYVTFRAMRIPVALAAAGSLLYALLPYHVQRIEHLFLTWYFVAPIFFLIAWRLYFPEHSGTSEPLTPRKALGNATALFAAASFGIYYALFGIVVLVLGGCGGWIRSSSRRVAATTLAAVFVTVIAIAINLAPNLLHTAQAGANPEIAHRSIGESEIFGLRMVQMLLPRANHRITAFGDATRRYDSAAPSVNENATATLGIVGAGGLLLLGAVIGWRVIGRAVDPRLAFLALIVLGLFALATVGGLSALIATLISPQVRGWNRASVFIAFAAIAAAMIALEWLVARFFSIRHHARVLAASGALVGILGVLDQTAPACEACNHAIQAAFDRDRAFDAAIERSVPPGAAIYQLPYVPFPEPWNHPLIYELATGMLNSQHLRWSYAAMKGRDGDGFLRMLANAPIARQLDVLQRLQFSGICVDRRGYADRGKAVEDELRLLLGSGPQIVRADDQVAFYRFGAGTTALPDGTAASRIAQLANFAPDADVAHYAATLAEGIDFRRPGLPAFVEAVRGLSHVESWGRWSDDNLSRNVTITFKEPLPPSFTLVLRAQAYGPNAGLPVSVRIGGTKQSILLSGGMQERRIRFEVTSAARVIEIIPPLPIAPMDLLLSHDMRRLGIGLERLAIEHQQ